MKIIARLYSINVEIIQFKDRFKKKGYWWLTCRENPLDRHSFQELQQRMMWFKPRTTKNQNDVARKLPINYICTKLVIGALQRRIEFNPISELTFLSFRINLVCTSTRQAKAKSYGTANIQHILAHDVWSWESIWWKQAYKSHDERNEKNHFNTNICLW